MAVPLAVRLAQKVKVSESGCWEWTGGLNTCGRPHVFVEKRDGRTITDLAHRAMYRLCFEDPGTKHVHHVCRNRNCVNPVHLRALEPPVHRGLHGTTHCPKGHSYAEFGRIAKGKAVQCSRCEYLREKARRARDPDRFREQRRAAYARKRSRQGKTVAPRL